MIGYKLLWSTGFKPLTLIIYAWINYALILNRQQWIYSSLANLQNNVSKQVGKRSTCILLSTRDQRTARLIFRWDWILMLLEGDILPIARKRFQVISRLLIDCPWFIDYHSYYMSHIHWLIWTVELLISKRLRRDKKAKIMPPVGLIEKRFSRICHSFISAFTCNFSNIQ